MMQPMAGPWLSPNEVTVNSFPIVFPDMCGIVPAPCRSAHVQAAFNMPTTGNLPRALVITRNLPPLVGGMERLIWHIVDELGTGYDVHVVGPAGCGNHLPPQAGATEVPLRPLWRFLLHATLASLRLARQRKPQLVFAGSGLTAPLAWLAARLSGGRCVTYLHGLDIETRHPAYRLLWHFFLRRCDLVIVNSRFTRSLAEAAGIDPARLQILHPGVELPDLKMATQLRAEFRRRHRLDGSPVMLYVGRITARKGLLPFVRDILPSVLEAVPAAHLIVIGGEPSDALLSDGGILREIGQSLEETGLGPHVHFLGELQADDPEIEAAYFAADVLVFPVQDKPGDNEGFGMVAIEAAAHGLATVAFSAGGVTDAVIDGQTGFLAPSGRDDMFSDALIRLLRETGGSGIHDSAVDFAAGFSWPRFGERLLRLCAQSRAQKGRPGR